VKGKDRSGTRFGIAIVGKAGYRAGAFIDKRQGIVIEVLEFACGIVFGLLFIPTSGRLEVDK